ncbi:MAG: YqgE/AlgH family protein [Chitinophagaceae bacterium]
MDFLNPSKQSGIPPAIGKLLIAAPMLDDPNFSRSVIIICEHSKEGTVGFLLNRRTQKVLGDLLPELVTPELQVYQGGPVQLDTLHMLHRMPAIFGGTEIVEGVYWGGNYDALQNAITDPNFRPQDLRLFAGYSGWGEGQLAKEMEEGSWVVANATSELIFDTVPDELWRAAIATLGSEFGYLVNIPINPQMN